MIAKRIQMSRQVPWKADNPNSVKVDRSTKFGNPFAAKIKNGEVGLATMTREYLVQDFRFWLTVNATKNRIDGEWVETLWGGHPTYLGVPISDRNRILDALGELQGKDLACWCPLDQPCHADVLLELANPVVTETKDNQ